MADLVPPLCRRGMVRLAERIEVLENTAARQGKIIQVLTRLLRTFPEMEKPSRKRTRKALLMIEDAVDDESIEVDDIDTNGEFVYTSTSPELSRASPQKKQRVQ